MNRRWVYPLWLRNQVIRNKIIAIYIPLIIVPLFVLGFGSNSIYTKAIVGKTIKNVSNNSSLILTRISGIVTNVESCANILTINLNRVIQDNRLEADGERTLLLSTLITNQLSFALLVFPDVESAAYIDNEGHIYGTSAAIEREAVNKSYTPMLQRLEQSTGKNLWFPMERRNYLTNSQVEPVLSLGKKINNIYTGQEMGLLVLNIKEQALSSIYGNISSEQSGSYILTDKGGTIVSSTDKQELLKPVADEKLRNWIVQSAKSSVIDRFQGEKQLVVSAELSKFDWKLISIEPFKALTADNRKITMLIVTIGAFCFLFALMGAGILNSLIARPIVLLTKSMKLVKEGNLNILLPVKSNDELGLLASGFNTMILRITMLLDNVRFEQKKKREYELALVQSQIKPHFLYNTLDVIYTLSELGRVKDVQRTTKALADYYRIVLSQGKEAISLADELQGLRDYLAIQRIRYADVFDFQIDVHQDLLQCTVLKLTLQPLVENAIYHGLKTKGTFGHLTVTGRREGRLLLLTVKDDGVGFSAQRLEAWRASSGERNIPFLWAEEQANHIQSLGELALMRTREFPLASQPTEAAEAAAPRTSGNSGSSYGLRSVDSRIKLYFGEAYGLTITSSPGAGTEVHVRLPIEPELEDKEHVESINRG